MPLSGRRPAAPVSTGRSWTLLNANPQANPEQAEPFDWAQDGQQRGASKPGRLRHSSLGYDGWRGRTSRHAGEECGSGRAFAPKALADIGHEATALQDIEYLLSQRGKPKGALRRSDRPVGETDFYAVAMLDCRDGVGG
jgi:hypothetical protein